VRSAFKKTPDIACRVESCRHSSQSPEGHREMSVQISSGLFRNDLGAPLYCRVVPFGLASPMPFKPLNNIWSGGGAPWEREAASFSVSI
jgi:hypothetical protein